MSDRGCHAELLNDRVEAIKHCVRLQSADGGGGGGWRVGGLNACTQSCQGPCESSVQN